MEEDGEESVEEVVDVSSRGSARTSLALGARSSVVRETATALGWRAGTEVGRGWHNENGMQGMEWAKPPAHHSP